MKPVVRNRTETPSIALQSGLNSRKIRLAGHLDAVVFATTLWYIISGSFFADANA
jgi:hypothetical protein